MKKLREAESDAKAVRTMTHRMVLTEEELVSFSNFEFNWPEKTNKHNLMFVFLVGRGSNEEVLACQILGIICQIWLIFLSLN